MTKYTVIVQPCQGMLLSNKKELLRQITTWTDLQGIVLSQKKQPSKVPNCNILEMTKFI